MCGYDGFQTEKNLVIDEWNLYSRYLYRLSEFLLFTAIVWQKEDLKGEPILPGAFASSKIF